MSIDPAFTTVVLEQLEQLITTLVIAAALIAYARTNTRILESISKLLESQIEPRVDVELSGDCSENSLAITNHAACHIADLSIAISVGCTRSYQAHPARQVVYAKVWESLDAGASVQADTQPIALDSLSDEGLPEGVALDPTDLVVNYSYVRQADQRRYAYKYRIGFTRLADGKQRFIRIDEPKHIVTSEAAPLSPVLAPRFSRPPSDSSISALEHPSACIG